MDLSRGKRGRRGGQQRQAQPQLFDDTGMMSPPMTQGHYGQLPFDAGVTQRHVTPNIYHTNLPPTGYPAEGSFYTQPSVPPPPQPQYAYPGQNIMTDPVASIAVSYGQTLANQGRDLVHQNLDKYVSSSKIKYYFAVDTSYVAKKLGLLFFPFLHKDWAVHFNQDEPVAPRYDVNAPDLYIPVMGLVTYILTAGFVLGTKNQFTPEHLGVQGSTCLVWLVLEILILLLSMYILQVSTDLRYLDLMAYCGYKYVGMISILVAWQLFEDPGYYGSWIWMSLSLGFFLVRSLKLAIVPHTDQHSSYGGGGGPGGSKRRLYVLMVIALTQPFFMWWLTRRVVNS